MYKHLGANLGQGKEDMKVGEFVNSPEARNFLDYSNTGIEQMRGSGG